MGAGTFQPIRTQQPPWRGPLPPLRAWILDALDRRHWDLEDADVVIDLHLDASLWVLGGGDRVRVIHRSDTYTGGGKARARRARLRQLAARGDRFVVHTQRASEDLTGIVGSDIVVELPLPGPDPSPRSPREPHSPPVLLFVGDARPEKGYELLLAAIEGLDFEVRHIGGYDRGVTRLSDAALAREYAECDLVVCPYLDVYATSGSGSLVVSEALAYAAPVVATPGLRQAFPAGYGGVEYAGTATPEALRQTLCSIDVAALGAAARSEAPNLAAERTGSAYLDGILSHLVSRVDRR